jgi:STE24 endopeptidase
MDPRALLTLYIALRVVRHAAERWLARLNRSHYRDPERQRAAAVALGITEADLSKSLAYTEDKYRFGVVVASLSLGATLIFLAGGGLGYVEAVAKAAAVLVAGDSPASATVQGLFFFALLGAASSLLSLPFEYYRTFVIEQRHGFNRQTRRGFWLDRVKGLVLSLALGGPLLAALLWIMNATGDRWWLWAWLVMSGFSIVVAWLYPTLLAPLFNKFTRLGAGELKDRIEALAAKVGFRAGGVFVMDASQRSSHGNAYFTGVFGEKRIVLFDTLLASLQPAETTAVLAHELGHFKLHHVRLQIWRGIVQTGLTFWVLSLCLPLEPFYRAFGLDGVSTYGALVVFGAWFGLIDFALQPLDNFISRRHEFAADAFARTYTDPRDLRAALLKLRETSHAMPISHPLYSAMYYSHPPLVERLAALVKT